MLWRETQKIRGDILADDMALSAETDGTLYTTVLINYKSQESL